MKTRPFPEELIIKVPAPGHWEVAYKPEVIQMATDANVGTIFFHHRKRKMAIATQLVGVLPMLAEIKHMLRRWENVDIYVVTSRDIVETLRLLKRELKLSGDGKKFAVIRVPEHAIVGLNTFTGEIEIGHNPR